MRYRSGAVGLLNIRAQSVHTVTATLTRARFQVVETSLSERTHSDIPAILIGDHGDVGVPTAIQAQRAATPNAALIALVENGEACSSSLLAIFRAGADDAVILPGEPGELIATIRLAVERSRLKQRDEQQTESFARDLGRKTRSLEEAFERSDQAYEETLIALVRALDIREQGTAGHSARVALYALRLALLVNDDNFQLESLYQGGLLHDIGKIGIPDSILLKPGPLTPEEFAKMQTHTTLAAHFLDGIPHLRNALQTPVYHHEKFDGSGYPYGLKGNSIPIAARVFAVVDVYDALRSRRSYKDPMSHDHAIDVMQRESNRHFDPEVLAAFMTQSESVWSHLSLHSERLPRFRTALRICEAVDERTPSPTVASTLPEVLLGRRNQS